MTFHLVEFDDRHAAAFRDLNVEWIEAMFTLEPSDREVLDHPRARIVDPGGAILFVATADLGIVGTGALRREADGVFELTKMGVAPPARGLKAGEFLLGHLIARAEALGATELYLLSNAACAAAIHLYEKNGFVHDAEVMARRGARYGRCNVAMRHAGDGGRTRART